MNADEKHIDNFCVNNGSQKQSPLEAMPTSIEKATPKKKSEQPEHILQPVSFNHMLNIEGRETDLPDAPKEDFECPAVPDMKKAEEDYNSIDYQIIAFNLWKSKARELF